MLKLGFAHALLLDLARSPEAGRRQPSFSDNFIQTLAPFDSGLFVLRALKRLGLLDEAQGDFLQRSERRGD